VLIHPTTDQMHQLGLTDMGARLGELETDPQSADLSHAEWVCPAARPRSHRCRMASARVGSPFRSCPRSTGIWLVIRIAPRP
jgi:hypothetical protein